MRKLLVPLVAAGLVLGSAAPGAGARVRSVRAGSPADQAGLEPGDVVITAGGHDVRSDEDLRAALSTPGRQAVAVRRDGAIRVVMVEVLSVQ
jgi:S1-C subfamily serine protease